MRRFLSGMLCFLMLFSLLTIPPVTADATTDAPENTDIQPLANTAEEESPDDVAPAAETDGFPKSGYVNGDAVRVRSGAGTSHGVVYTLDKNAPVTIHKQERANDLDWGQLDDGNWIALKYVTFVDKQQMTSSQAFVDILKQREGFSATPYWDVSHYSIGYGTSVPSDKVSYYKKNPITEAEGERMMREHLLDFEEAVLKYAEKYSLELTQNQFDGLVSFCYNCGDSWLRETNGFMNRAVREGWKGSDFVYAMCLWSKAGSDYILMNRRMYEANMYLNNIYESPYDYEKGTFRYVFLEAGQGAVRYIVHGFDSADPKPIRYEITKYPTGVDKNGNPFTYTFDGWYTAQSNGKKVENLDGQIGNNTLLYAMWKDPDGNVVYLEKGVPCDNVQVKIMNVDSTVNVRSGPGTFYAKIGTIKKGTIVTLTHVYDDGKNQWGRYEGGWFSLAYSDYDGSLEQQPEEVFPQYGTVTTDGVNVRSGPGTSNPSQYKLNKGDTVTILQKTKSGSMEWGQLEDGNWISLSYVTITPNIPDGPDPEPNPDPDPEPEKLVSSQELIDVMKFRLGFSSSPYWGDDSWKIGYGSRISEQEMEQYQKNPISMDKADELLKNNLKVIEEALHSFAAANDLVFTQNQFDALVYYTHLSTDSWLSDTECLLHQAVKLRKTGSDFVYAICLDGVVDEEYTVSNARLMQANMYLNGVYEKNYNSATGPIRYVFLDPGLGEVDDVIHGFNTMDPIEIQTLVTKEPTGINKDGTPFTYQFAGWYTSPENGTKVTQLDAQVSNASVLYALWQDPSDNIVYLAKGDPCVVKVTITNAADAYVHAAPGRYYPNSGRMEDESTATVIRVYDDGVNLWGQLEAGGWIDLSTTNYDQVCGEPDRFPKAGYVNTDNVNVRAGASTSYDVVYKLNKYDPVTIYQQAYDYSMYWGQLEDGNWIALNYVTFGEIPVPDPDPNPDDVTADFDGSGVLDKDDAIYLLRHVVYPELYPISASCDTDGNGVIDKDDAIYLLRHVVYPELYPLNFGE